MNQLNSIIVEGSVEGAVVDVKSWYGTDAKAFKVLSTCILKPQGMERQSEVSSFTVEVEGVLADTCAQYISDGRGVRIVGRVECRPAIARMVLHASHVEFRK